MRKLVTVAQMRAAEQRAAELGVSEAHLMERAGRAAASIAAHMPGGMRLRRVVVLVGPGNNGGDGLVAARFLQQAGARVACALALPRAEDDPHLRAATEAGVDIRAVDDPELLDDVDLVIDALLGTGRARPLDGPIAAALDRVATARASAYGPALLALDLPTGVDADTGASDPHAVAADRTVAFGYGKIGLYTQPGATLAGHVDVVDIGLPETAAPEPAIELLDAGWVAGALPPRGALANKGTFGRAMIAAGSERYPGAAALAAAAALRTGAGLATLACPEGVQRLLAGSLWEATFLPLPEREGTLCGDSVSVLVRELAGYDALLAGPGISQTHEARAFVGVLLPALAAVDAALVLDADALNALARSPGWHERLRLEAILTPHPGEMARLTGLDPAAVQSNRLQVALDAARTWGHVVVLKGANTIVAAPDGRARLSPIATAALATAGTGDVLAGAIVALLAQGMERFDAASAAVWLHGRAGERVGERAGTRGVLAGDVLAELPAAIHELTTG